MKNFWEGLLEWKTSATFIFTASIVLFTIVFFLLGEGFIPINYVISIFIVSVIGAFIRFLAFTDRIIKKASYTLRLIIFAIPAFILLAANAFFFTWFPPHSGYWLTFCLIFLIIFVALTVAYEIYYYYMGKKYDGLLGIYRRKKTDNDSEIT